MRKRSKAKDDGRTDERLSIALLKLLRQDGRGIAPNTRALRRIEEIRATDDTGRPWVLRLFNWAPRQRRHRNNREDGGAA
jgi:hypothetical protein